MSNEYELIKEWRGQHDVYATLDRNPTDANQIILVKDNKYLIKKLQKDEMVTVEFLDKALEEFNDQEGST